MQEALFAAGCFWGVQHYFDQIPGVISTKVGYTGGHVVNPTYEQVCQQTTGHAEAILVEFDPKLVDYGLLCRHFFRLHDPTQLNRQGPDVGDNYRSVIYYFNESQKKIAEDIIKDLQSEYSQPIVTELTRAVEFYPAEDYHQKYSQKTGRGICHVAYEEIT